MVVPDRRFQGDVKSEAAARFVLGLSPGCTAEEIKKAFKRLALVFHPDKNQGDKTDEAKRRFQMIARAKDLLLEKPGPAKRAGNAQPAAPKQEPPKEMRAEWRCSACDIQDVGDSPGISFKRTGTCVRLNPKSICFCGHPLSKHTMEGFKCSCPGCLCSRFQYVPPRAECTCGHTSARHSAIPFHNCEEPGCFCQTFHCPDLCSCGHEWSCHNTVFVDASKQQTPRRPQSARNTAASRSPASPDSSSSEEPLPRARARPSSAKPSSGGPGSVPPPGFGPNMGDAMFGAQFGIHISGCSNVPPPAYKRPRPQSAHAGTAARARSRNSSADGPPKPPTTPSGSNCDASASRPSRPQSASVGGRWGARTASSTPGAREPAEDEGIEMTGQNRTRSPSVCQPCDGASAQPDLNGFMPASRPLTRAFGGAPAGLRTRSGSVGRSAPIRSTDTQPQRPPSSRRAKNSAGPKAKEAAEATTSKEQDSKQGERSTSVPTPKASVSTSSTASGSSKGSVSTFSTASGSTTSASSKISASACSTASASKAPAPSKESQSTSVGATGSTTSTPGRVPESSAGKAHACEASAGTSSANTSAASGFKDASHVPFVKSTSDSRVPLLIGAPMKSRVIRSHSQGLLDPKITSDIPKANDAKPRPRSASRARDEEEDISSARAAEAGAFKPAQHLHSHTTKPPLTRPSAANRSSAASISPRSSTSPSRAGVVNENLQASRCQMSSHVSDSKSPSCTSPTPRSDVPRQECKAAPSGVGIGFGPAPLPVRSTTTPRTATPPRPASPDPALGRATFHLDECLFEGESAASVTAKAAATAAASAATAAAAMASAASMTSNAGLKPCGHKERPHSGSSKRPVSASKNYPRVGSRPPSASRSSSRHKTSSSGNAGRGTEADEDRPASGSGSRRPSRPGGIPHMPDQSTSASGSDAHVTSKREGPWWERLYNNTTTTSAYRTVSTRSSSASRSRHPTSVGSQSRGSSKEDSTASRSKTQSTTRVPPAHPPPQVPQWYSEAMASQANRSGTCSTGDPCNHVDNGTHVDQTVPVPPTSSSGSIPFPTPFPGPPLDTNFETRHSLLREDSFIYSDNEEGVFGVDSDEELQIPTAPRQRPSSTASQRPPSATRRGQEPAHTQHEQPKDWAEEVLERLRREHLTRVSLSSGPGSPGT
eukprot:gnl/MRDRNA2_/MRDRNA2_140158_c0_seq1.p1 gnl/MRDRNA2_/MRDRNA2_140158_c0~~gnl/MRDRNA2_/MRDRNA2_140158_c0_seq1.p1  ORF type:complete len:1169 (-),score=145.11 gnl/MRDRNA2_/MRDRNA2_140158_c0_seq1:18-3524(-)